MRKTGIVIIGMAGVGKSTIGMGLAQTLGYDFLDVDDYIFQQEGKRIQELIDSMGEEAFLDLEKRHMLEITLPRMVVAPGGSIIYHPDLMEYLRGKAVLVYLDDSFRNIEAKLTGGLDRGIVGLRYKTLRQIYEERRPLYFKYADIIIDCRGKKQGALVGEILKRYRQFTRRQPGLAPQ
jgi:shikimate kinase